MTLNKHLFLVYSAIIILIGATLCSAQQEPTTAPSAATQRKYFTFEVEAAANRDAAHALEENLMDKGYPAYVEELFENTGKITYRVCVGKYQTSKDAEKAAQAFYEQENVPYLIRATQLAHVESLAAAITTPSAERSPQSPQNELSSVRSEKNKSREPAAERKVPDTPIVAFVPTAAESNNAWPDVVSRIYSYYDPQGFLRITNSAEEILGESQEKIESISIFPVKYLSFNQKNKVLVLDVAGKQEELQLSGVDLDTSAAVKNAAAYFEKNLKDVPLRLKYAPVLNDEVKKKTIRGDLFFKQGTPINIELVRQGIAPPQQEASSFPIIKENKPAAAAPAVALIEEKKLVQPPAEKKKVIVPPQKEIAINATVYCINVALCKFKESADVVIADLQRKGYEPAGDTITVRGNKWFRVTLGHFQTQGEAQNYARELLSKEHIKGFIVKKKL
jgi:cell division septation protein DedD